VRSVAAKPWVWSAVSVREVFALVKGWSGGCNLDVDVGFIAYKENTKLGRDSIGANQNGARKHHFCALLMLIN
jgi:hypothetical protein